MKIFEMELKLSDFLQHLRLEEYAENSVNGYKKDLYGLFSFLEDVFGNNYDLKKEILIEYKKTLTDRLKPASVNRKIAAINKFLDFLNLPSFKLKSLKVQERTTSVNALTEQEFTRLIKSALQLRKQKIALIMLTLAATGIRISELKYITVKVVRHQKVTISNKGKIRILFIPAELCQKLITFARDNDITSGSIFLGNTGQPISRPYISREMKSVANSCGVDSSKAFPHNFRHYFARKFLDCGNHISDLADVLGHTNVNTTRRYLRSSEKLLRKQMEKLKLLPHTYVEDFFLLWAG